MHLNWGFLKFQLGNEVTEKNQNNTNTTQICFETLDSFEVSYDMYLTCRLFKIQSRNRFREKIKITQIQPRFDLKLTIYFKFGRIRN